MAGFDYTTMQSVASELLEYFGGASERTITYDTGGSFNSTTQTFTKSTSTFTGWGVVSQYDQDEVDGVTILSSDLRLVLQKTSRRPEVDNTVSIDGDDYRIKAVEVSNPGGVDLLYICQVGL